MKKRKRVFGIKDVHMVGALILSLLLCLTTTERPAFGGEVLTKYMIGDKEYRVETIEGEPDNYMIYLGDDDQYKWEPLPYMPDYYVKEGPLFYERWIKPGNPYPWDISLEERTKLDVNEIYKLVLKVEYYGGPRPYPHAVIFPNILVDPKGRERDKLLQEYMRGYITPEAKEELPEDLRGVLGRKYMYIMHAPDDIAVVGGLNLDYQIDKPSDLWFYTPSVRKVRRLSEGSRQDFLPGSNYRNEDFAITRFYHNYKMIGTELYKPPLSYIGYPNHEAKHWSDLESKRFHGEGQPTWVIEETPRETPWWFHKHVRRINMKDMSYSLSEAYDEKGRMIRHATHGGFLFDPAKYPIYRTWINWSLHDLTTGYKTYGPCNYGKRKGHGESVYYYPSGMPEKAFAPASLLKEPTSKLLFWGKGR